MKFLSLTVFAILIAAVCCAEIDPRCPGGESEGSSVTYIPHESDCSKYYMCSNGVSHLMQCPKVAGSDDHLHWDTIEQTCNWPAVAKCEL
ncbi:peritrophin-1-like [Culicoides brevitarsis]|uniref:peritrophin-1-like n=1 Tax=Culicoides brevitarsis TaxID=469753 RepID=UPI00307C3327